MEDKQELASIRQGIKHCISTAKQNIANLERSVEEALKEENPDRMLWLLGSAIASYEESVKRAAPVGLTASIGRIRERLGEARARDAMAARALREAEGL